MDMQNLMKLLLIGFVFFINTSILGANDLKSLQDGKINFDTYYTYDQSRLNSLIYKDAPLDGIGTLYLPKNLDENDKVPLAIILHTSGGIENNREIFYAKSLNKNGIAAYVIDTYGTRKCNASGSGWKNCINRITLLDFVTDAYMALNRVSNHPNIDKENTALIGYSYGGDAAMLALDNDIKNIFSPNQIPFKAAISVYGACNNIFDIKETTKTPFHYIVGSEDISYDKEYCKARYIELESAGSKSYEYILDGAVHMFDAKYRVMSIPTSELPNTFKCQYYFSKDGSVEERISGVKIKFKSEDSLDNKFKITNDFAWEDTKSCFGKERMKIGKQNSAKTKTKDLLSEILSDRFLLN